MLMATTCAPGTTSPPESVTVPTSAVWEASCAKAPLAERSTRPRPTKTRRIILNPPVNRFTTTLLLPSRGRPAPEIDPPRIVRRALADLVPWLTGHPVLVVHDDAVAQRELAREPTIAVDAAAGRIEEPELSF